MGERGNLVHLQFVSQNITWYKIIALKKQCEGWKMRSIYYHAVLRRVLCLVVNVCETHVHTKHTNRLVERGRWGERVREGN